MKIYTIKDIARKAGVSVTTVSRVLNKRPDVNQATREKVERVMAECRFVGNANARGLKQPDGDLIAIILREDDDLVGVELTQGDDDLILGTRKGMCIRFSESHIRAMGRSSMGVKSISLAEGDEVIDMAPVEEGAHVLAITQNGYGKRTETDEYREQGRAGKGIRAMNLTDKTGDLAALLLVHPEEDILLITDDGTIIRTHVDDIRICGRATQGVRIMKLSEGSRVAGVARAEAEPEEEAETPAETADTSVTEEVSAETAEAAEDEI